MLVQLHIRNYALIDHIEVEFGPGFNVLTGETGAGKSMIVGALGLVLGQRAQSDIVRSEEKPTVVEALFDISAQPHVQALLDTLGIALEEPTLVLKRLITKNGNRCYINAHLATVTMLQQVGQHLVAILGQHQYHTLLAAAQQLSLLDAFGNLMADLASLRTAYQRYQELRQACQHLQQEEQQRLQRQDLLRFQIQEIDRARLHSDEEERLQQERRLLANAEKLHELSQRAYAALYGDDRAALERLAEALTCLDQLVPMDPRLSTLRDTLQTSLYTLEDVAQSLRKYCEQLDTDPERLQSIEDRLAEIARLKRKYGATIADILRYREQIAQEQRVWEQREEHLQALTAQLDEQRRLLKSLAVTLSDKRQQTAVRLQQAVQRELQELHMAGATFRIACTLRRHPQGDCEVGSERVLLTADGIDEVMYLFASSPGQPLRPLARVASGGELSRLMLALKSVLAREDRIPTLIFDEVDAGIGGKTAKIVGEKLRRIAHTCQLFCITHLPQIASHADQHYRVEKRHANGRTTVEVHPLDFAARIDEIARMSGGREITETTRKHAEELLSKRC